MNFLIRVKVVIPTTRTPILFLLRTLLLLGLLPTMRTLSVLSRSESVEESSGSPVMLVYEPLESKGAGTLSHTAPHHHHTHIHPETYSSSSSSSLENSVKYPHLSRQRRGHHYNNHHNRNNGNNNNAIVRASISSSKGGGGGSLRHHPQQFNFARSEGSGGGGCPNCATAQQNQIPVRNQQSLTNRDLHSAQPDMEDTFKKMRLELIKKQILKKLRLKEPPKPPPTTTSNNYSPHLPSPVLHGDTLPKRRDESEYSRDVEDFYGKTEQVIVFPEEEAVNCGHTHHPASCFKFKLPREIRHEEIGSVLLWGFKLEDPHDGQEGSHTFYVDDKIRQGSSSSTSEEDEGGEGGGHLVQDKITSPQSSGWFSLNLTRVVTTWLKQGQSDKTLEFGCSTCSHEDGISQLGSPIGTLGEDRPFLVFNMGPSITKKRSRRHIICAPNVTECCRERFTVNFKEIGWDWIIGPQSYDAFFCKGSCSLSTSASLRGSIMTRYINTREPSNNTAELMPCCTPTRMSSIDLIYNDWGHNSTVARRRTEKLPNMVVESCGCL